MTVPILDFTLEDIYMAKNSRVWHFLERNTKDAEGDQDDKELDIQPGWKRKADPSQ